MPSMMSFTLNFSGTGVFEQQQAAKQLLQLVDAGDYAARTRLYAIIAAASVFSHPEDARAAAASAIREFALAAGEGGASGDGSGSSDSNKDKDNDSEIARPSDDGSGDGSKRAGSDDARAWALIAETVVDLSCATTERRLANTREVLAIAQRTRETEYVSTAYFLYLGALAELGQMDELDQALSSVGPILSSFPKLNEGRHAAWFRCLQATLDGQLNNAEQLAYRAHTVAEADGDPDAQSVMVGQLAIIRWAQGRVVELEPAFLQARQSAPHEPIWAVSLAWIWLRQGRKSAAHALVASLPQISAMPIDRNWLSTTCILSDVASELGELEIVQQAYDALLPFDERLVTIGLGVTCWGTVARPLALAANALGNTDAAVSHYRKAIEVAARSGAHPWLVESQWELALLLTDRAHPGDHEEATSLAAEATAASSALDLLGYDTLASQVLATLQEPSSVSPSKRAEPDLDLARPQIVVCNEFSVASAHGTVAHWQSRKARQLLKILVARRGAAISRETAMDLLWPDESADRLANRFSVAVSAVRRALDPTGSRPKDTYLDNRDGLIRLRVDAVDIDIERFLLQAAAALASSAPDTERKAHLARALSLYVGEPLHEEQAELWAASLRREVQLAFFSVSHAFAELCGKTEDHLSRLDTYRNVLAMDPYDQRAHEGMIDALEQLGSHGQAEAARAEYSARMRELGVGVI